MVWGGANEAFAYVFGGGTPGLGNDPLTKAENIGDQITRLAAAGGRTFLVPNLSRVSQIPLVQLDPQLQPLTPVFDGWTTAFNAQHETGLDNSRAELGVTILQFDWKQWADDALARAEELGFSNVTEPACPACAVGIPAPDAAASVVAQPANYAFWDAVHPSAAYHKLLGNALADFVKKELRIPETVTLSFSEPLSETGRTYGDPGTLTGVGYADPARANEFLNQIRAERGQEHFAARLVNTGTHSLYGRPLSHRMIQLSYRDGQGGFDWYNWFEESYPDGSILFGEAVGNLSTNPARLTECSPLSAEQSVSAGRPAARHTPARSTGSTIWPQAVSSAPSPCQPRRPRLP